MSLLNELQKVYLISREKQLHGRYITMDHIKNSSFYIHYTSYKKIIGFSVQKRPIELFTIGKGAIKIVMWSQMHGNESTTTKAMVDFFNFLAQNHHIATTILTHCTLYGIPILNPDGALVYTRENANGIDINRDIQRLSQPESRILRQLCNEVSPHFCFNLHDQRSIYGVGNTSKSAVISFLSPLQNKEATITPTRKKAMRLIVAMNMLLQEIIPGHVGRFDDTFNLDCAGDFFQSLHIPTILFEAGHFKHDYEREETRTFIFYALVQSIYTLSENSIDKYLYEDYFSIPENKKTFFDVLITQIPSFSIKNNEKHVVSIGIIYRELLKKDTISFFPKIERKGDLRGYYGHQIFDYKDNIAEILEDKNISKIVTATVKS